MLLSRRFSFPFLVGLLLFAGVAQAQNSPSGTNPQSSEMKADGGKYLQPWQPSLNADFDQFDQEGKKKSPQEETPKSSKTVNVPLMNQPNSQDKTKKAARVTDTKKSTESGISKAESFGPSSRQYGMSNAQSKGPQFGASKSGLIGTEYNQSSSVGSTSFLDGYLLKSLHDEGISRKKIRNEEKSKDDLRPRGKTSF